MNSVLQDWVMELPLRAQGTLLTGVRGCDLTPKVGGVQSSERNLAAFLRFCILNPADPREVDIPNAFFRSSAPENWKASEFGHYPQHWYAHIMHCFEVVGYCHPVSGVREKAFMIYFKFVSNLHLKPETYFEMITRLTEDRIASGNTVS